VAGVYALPDVIGGQIINLKNNLSLALAMPVKNIDPACFDYKLREAGL
jgi:hypothetical protein